MAAIPRRDVYEHIAGPGCKSPMEYSGHRISAEEMRGCTTVQCLIPETDDWEPEDGDCDFEADSAYHLTGLASHMPSGGWRLIFGPRRHGVEHRDADISAFTIAVRLVLIRRPLLCVYVFFRIYETALTEKH